MLRKTAEVPFFVRRLLVFILLSGAVCTEQAVAQQPESGKARKGGIEIPPFQKQPERYPKVPLKHKRMIFSDAEIRIARDNVSRFAEAASVRDSIVKNAEKWLGWSDQALYDLLTDARVPRAFDLNSGGCPVHGDAIFKKGGTYPWIMNPRDPFKVKCPVGNEVYPSNDYGSYYKSDFKVPIDKTAEFTDYGWGWVAPNGERYWFVAHANHWLWRNNIQSGISDLARSYLLTGEKRYAHKALVMLYRLAEVYPSMNHEDQSRYGLMSKAEGRVYKGKIINQIWECRFIQSAAEAYDIVWDAIDGDAVLHGFLRKGGKDIRSFIEANLLEEAVEAYFARKIQGNFGMHQMALLNILLARQHAETGKYVKMLVDEPGVDRPHTGIRFALYNQVFRDGLPLESPDYNMGWVNKLAEISQVLKKGGEDLFDDSRFKMLFDAPLEIVTTGLYTPDWGDSGSVLGRVSGRSGLVDAYQTAYAATTDPDYLTWMASIHKTGSNSFSTFGSLFREALPQTEPLPGGRAVKERSSRLFAGYETGILNNAKDKTSVSFTYGMHVSHFHYDFLNFEVFANRQKMMPDLGYPDAANVYVAERYTWGSNTAAHNTVVVDARRQQQNLPGVLHDFSEGSFARSMDASSPAYKNATQYRRNLVMVDVDQDQSYVVDFFNVRGGRQHDYILHGPPGSFSELSGTLGAVQPGTLAGPDVEPGRIYDDKKLGAKGYSGSFGSYNGSGYQHFFNVQKLEKGNSIAQYAHVNDPDARLRIHMENLPEQTIFQADAYDKPRARLHTLKYLIVRREGAGALQSSFVSVIEPFSKTPYILSTKRLSLTEGSGTAVEITRAKAVDVVLNDTVNTVKKLAVYGIETDANSVVLTFDIQKKKLLRVFFSNGTYLKHGKSVFKNENMKGAVSAVDMEKGQVKVVLDEAYPSDIAHGSAPTAHFTNKYRKAVHPLTSLSMTGKKELTLQIKDALLIGKLRIEGADNHIARTSTNLPLEKTYNGATLLDQAFAPLAVIENAVNGKIKLSPEKEVGIRNLPADCWLSSIGVGDRMVYKNSFSREFTLGK